MISSNEIKFLRKLLKTNKLKVLKKVESNNENYVIETDFGKFFLKKTKTVSKYYNEFFFHVLLYSLGIPVSKIFAYSETSRVLVLEYKMGIRGDFLIMNGKGKKVYSRMGQLLKEVHSFEFKFPQIIGSLPLDPAKYVQTKVFETIEKEKTFLSKVLGEESNLLKRLDKFDKIIFTNSSIRICHNDYQPENVIFGKNEEIINLCDFEISSFFDFEYDLARTDFLNCERQGFNYFWKTYGNYEKNEKFYFYRLISSLNYAISFIKKKSIENLDVSYLLEYLFENYWNIGSHTLRNLVMELANR